MRKATVKRPDFGSGSPSYKRELPFATAILPREIAQVQALNAANSALVLQIVINLKPALVIQQGMPEVNCRFCANLVWNLFLEGIYGINGIGHLFSERIKSILRMG